MNDYVESGLSRYLLDPDDGLWARRKLAGVASTFRTETFPMNGWTKDQAKIPSQFCYGSIYEYLVDRKVPFMTGKCSGIRRRGGSSFRQPAVCSKASLQGNINTMLPIM